MNKKNSLNSNQDRLPRIRIILASCYPLILQALRVSMEKQQDMEVIAETGGSDEAVNLAARLNPDIVIIDIDMPGLGGLEATKQILERSPGTKILILTRNGDSEKVQESGASAYLPKRAPIELIFHTVRTMVTERSDFPQQFFPDITRDGSNSLQPMLLNKLEVLTPKELSILKLVAKGISNKEIALRLAFSVPNVKVSLTAIFRKLGVSSRTEAISVGLKSGILSFSDLNQ